MKRVLIGVLVLAALYGAAAGYVASQYLGAFREREKQNAAIAALGEKISNDVQMISTTGPSLKEACAGKLTPGPRRTIVEYAVKVREGDRVDARLDGVLYGMTDNETAYLERTPMDPPGEPQSFAIAFAHAESPDDWPRLLENTGVRLGYTRQLKYVVVTYFSDLEPARPSHVLLGDGKTFTAGHSSYRSRVVAFPSGEKICEGIGEGRLEQKKVTGHGGSAADARAEMERKLAGAWTSATLASPLDDLCAAGGEALCSATRLDIDAPDW